MEIMNNNKIAYEVNVKGNDGYDLGHYFFKFTQEELNIIQWFLTETGTMYNFDLIKMQGDIFSERGRD